MIVPRHVGPKRALDLTVTSLALLVTWPFLLIIGAAIRLTSSGPVLFVQRRLGMDGKQFSMYKFRTMVDGAQDMDSGLFSYHGDDRVTSVGGLLRKFSADELPQLFNVLNGTMSIVGPRPPVVNELGDYEDFSETMRLRFKVKPGITGLAQISGRNALTWPEKIEIDNEYVRLFAEQGIHIDLRILWRTAAVVLTARNVIEPQRSTSPDEGSESEINSTGRPASPYPARD